MRKLLKYFFWLLSLLSIFIYSLLGTTLGNRFIGNLVEHHYNKKMKNKIEVRSLNIKNYPHVLAEIKINNGAVLKLNGVANRDDMNISYRLQGDTFQWGRFSTLEAVDVKGSMQGKISALSIVGVGKIFNGHTNYTFTRTTKQFENLKVKLNEVDATSLQEFLKYDFKIEGATDVVMDFKYFSPLHKKGFATIHMKQGKIPKFSTEQKVTLDSKIAYRDNIADFSVRIDSDAGTLQISNGLYNKSAKIIDAKYNAHIKELSYFKQFLKHQYHGQLDTIGELKYESKKLALKGSTKTYGGLIEYAYKNHNIDMQFEKVSLSKLLLQLSFPALLSGKVNGVASYELQDKILLLNTKLKEVRFRRTKMTDTIYKVTKIDVLKDVYDDSMFTAGYQNSILTSYLKIDNGVNHLYLSDTKMNAKTNKITSNFEVFIDKQEFLGEIYGTLENPKVNLNMSKLIKYQVNKQIDNFFGMGKPLNRKNTEIKLKKMKNNFKHKIKQKAHSFLEDFF